MGKPAARLGDATTAPHSPSTLGAPAPASANVLIGGKRAWRANIDKTLCTTPVAPPAPAPHGPETCFLGSLTVMINGQMAVRQGDILVGAGPPNVVSAGCPTVLIGDVGFGLAAPNNMDQFCQDLAEVNSRWSKLTPEQRETELEKVINKQLAKSGVPPQGVVGDATLRPGNAQYDFTTGQIQVSQSQLSSATMNEAQARKLANVVYHEARHAEQWYLMARHAAGQGATSVQMAGNMHITRSMAQAAAQNPLTGVSPQGNLAQSCYASVYGPRGNYRNEVLNNIQRRYREYRALPEEQDAWRTGDSTPCGAPVR